VQTISGSSGWSTWKYWGTCSCIGEEIRNESKCYTVGCSCCKSRYRFLFILKKLNSFFSSYDCDCSSQIWPLRMH
jgi:hypothetical protein